jgi:hypothetical protein
VVPLQAALIALSAFILAPGLLFDFDVTPKIAVILVGTAVALAMQARHLPRPDRRPNPFVFALALSALAVAISTLASTHPALSLFGSNWRRFGAIVQFAILAFTYLIYARCAGHRERTQLVLRVIAGASVLTAVYGIAQYFGIDPLLPSAVYHVGEGKWQIVRPPSTLGYVS